MSWFDKVKNLQGQLTELASEVLNEATEEVADPESELQVTKRECSELKSQLQSAVAKCDVAERKQGELEEQLYSAHVEMDSVGSKYVNMISSRDEEIKRLKMELEQARASLHEDDLMDEEMKAERIEELKREIAHWKSLVVQGPSADSGQLEELRRKKDTEISALMEMYEEKMKELREYYEDKLARHTGATSSSENSSDTALLDAVLLEKEELIEEKKRLEEELSRRKLSTERAVLVDVAERTEGETATPNDVEEANQAIEALSQRLKEAEDDLARLREQPTATDEHIKNLTLQNSELTMAYNDLNRELDVYKEREGRVFTTNRDLMNRIDSLKADVIEYEEKYEFCKSENAETVKQLEKLTADFERLRTGLAETKSKSANSDASMAGEVEKLRGALERSKYDRDNLRSDVDKFKGAIDSIDTELNQLRDVNARLTEENATLAAQLDVYDGSVKNVINRSETDLKAFKEEFKELQRIQEQTVEEKEGGEAASVLSWDDNEWWDSDEKESSYSERERTLLQEIASLKEIIDSQNAADHSLGEASTRPTENEDGGWEGGEEEAAIEILRPEFAAPTGSSRPDQERTLQWEDISHMANNESSLTLQLKEALSANTELTDECDSLRQDKEDLEKEVNVRQACIDEMIQQTSMLHLQQQQAANNAAILRKEMQDKHQAVLEFEVKLYHEKEQNEKLAADYAELEAKLRTEMEMERGEERARKANPERERELEEAREERRHLLERVGAGDQRLNELMAENSELRHAAEKAKEELSAHLASAASSSSQSEESAAILGRAEERVAALEGENSQLKSIATQKHEESLAYYNQLQAASSEAAVARGEVDEARASVARLDESLKTERDRSEKAARELDRLKEHLVMVEETSVVEAKEAEERETRLLARVRALEAAQTQTLSCAEETTHSTQAQIHALQLSLRAAEADASQSAVKLNRTEKERAEGAEALASLQSVVRDLAAEHERDSAEAAHHALLLEHQLKEQAVALESLRGECDRLGLDRQAAEDAAAIAREAVEAKQKIVEELEIRLDEAHSAASSKAVASSSQYRIDDATLRQLFLSYFTAPVDRRGDIALLLASILEYSPEDVEKVRSAVRPGPPAGHGGDRPSLAEQFVRFLESESESSRTAPQLAVATERTPINADVPASRQMSSAESSSALKAMLQPPSSSPAPPSQPPTNNP